MPWNPDDLFTFRIYFSSMKNLCVLKRIIWTSFTHGVGNSAGLGSLPPRKQSLRKPLSICKFFCVSTVNAAQDTTDNAPGIHIKVNLRLPIMFIFIFVVLKRCYCNGWTAERLNGWTAERLVIIPQDAFLGHLGVNLRVTLWTHALIVFYVFNTRICVGLSSAVSFGPTYDLRPPVCSL